MKCRGMWLAGSIKLYPELLPYHQTTYLMLFYLPVCWKILLAVYSILHFYASLRWIGLRVGFDSTEPCCGEKFGV